MLEIKRQFEKIELDALCSQKIFLNIFRYLMRLAIEDIPGSIIPLPSIIFFLKYLIFKGFKLLYDRQIAIYREILELLAGSGNTWIIKSKKEVELAV
ncbi:MAG: hypothetical protein ACFFD2_05430 [Promethearchaeota archaeon]